jgi:AcrR family transcriptional regulator
MKPEDKRQKILKAAVSLFLQKGFDSTTMDEIAVRSRIAKGTLYLYFRDKADLYISLLEERISDLHKAFAEVIASPASPSEKLEAIIRRNLEYIARQYSGAEFIADSSAGHDPEILKLLRSRITPRFAAIMEQIAGVIREGAAKGEFRAVDPLETAASIFSLVNIHLMRRALDSRPIDPEREARSLKDLIFNGVAAGIVHRSSFIVHRSRKGVLR